MKKILLAALVFAQSIQPANASAAVLAPRPLGAIAPFTVLAGLLDFLKSLHGTPPARPPLKPEAKAAAVAFASDVKVDVQILDFLQALAEAIRAHDGKPMLPRLSAKYTIDDLPEGRDPIEFFLLAIGQVKGADEIVAVSIEREGDLRIARAEFRSADNPAKRRVFKFDAAGKLLWSDFFLLKRQHGDG